MVGDANRCDEHGGQMEHECHPGVEEYPDDDWHHAEWNGIDVEKGVLLHGSCNGTEDGWEDEKHEVCSLVEEIVSSENIQERVEHDDNKQYEECLSEVNLERLLVFRHVFHVRLIGLDFCQFHLIDDFAPVDDFLIFLDSVLFIRNGFDLLVNLLVSLHLVEKEICLHVGVDIECLQERCFQGVFRVGLSWSRPAQNMVGNAGAVHAVELDRLRCHPVFDNLYAVQFLCFQAVVFRLPDDAFFVNLVKSLKQALAVWFGVNPAESSVFLYEFLCFIENTVLHGVPHVEPSVEICWSCLPDAVFLGRQHAVGHVDVERMKGDEWLMVPWRS